jgi:PilZ domain
MNNSSERKATRTNVNMKIRSVSLPHFAADIIDISESGARVVLAAQPDASLLESRIRFGASLNTQMTAQFEGYARVAWIRETENGLEAGLQWEKMTDAAWQRAKAAMVIAA